MKNLQWLSYLTTGEQVLFCKNLVNLSAKIKTKVYASIAEYLIDTPRNWDGFIGGGFVWEGSPEGHDYWSLIANRDYPTEFIQDIHPDAGVWQLLKMPYRLQVTFLKNLSSIPGTGCIYENKKTLIVDDVSTTKMWPISRYLLSEFNSFESFLVNSFEWERAPEKRYFWEQLSTHRKYK
jgi:hypothetical protein